MLAFTRVVEKDATRFYAVVNPILIAKLEEVYVVPEEVVADIKSATMAVYDLENWLNAQLRDLPFEKVITTSFQTSNPFITVVSDDPFLKGLPPRVFSNLRSTVFQLLDHPVVDDNVNIQTVMDYVRTTGASVRIQHGAKVIMDFGKVAGVEYLQTSRQMSFGHPGGFLLKSDGYNKYELIYDPAGAKKAIADGLKRVKARRSSQRRRNKKYDRRPDHLHGTLIAVVNQHLMFAMARMYRNTGNKLEMKFESCVFDSVEQVLEMTGVRDQLLRSVGLENPNAETFHSHRPDLDRRLPEWLAEDNSDRHVNAVVLKELTRIRPGYARALKSRIKEINKLYKEAVRAHKDKTDAGKTSTESSAVA